MITLEPAGGGRSGGQALWTQRNVFANLPTVRRNSRKGGRAPSLAPARSGPSLGPLLGGRTTLRLALAASDRELRV